MTDDRGPDSGDRAPVDAEGWFARMRGPNARRWDDELAAWRAQHPDNDADYARLLQRWDQTAFLTNSALGRGRDLERAAVWYRRPAVRIMGVAASIVLVACVGVLTMTRTGILGKAPTAFEYTSNARAVRVLALVDGTRVTLDAGSALSIDAAAPRTVRLVRGRARFEVARTGARFVVNAHGGSVVADDGQFDVGLGRQFVRVVAWRGALDVAGPAVQPIRIAAGQRALFDPVRGMTSVGQADPGELGWTNGMLSFERVRLADAVTAINRYNRVRIGFGSADIGELRITGAFRASDPEGFAQAVADMFHLSLGKTGTGAIMLSHEKKA